MTSQKSPIVDFGAHVHPNPPEGSGIFNFIQETDGLDQSDPDQVAQRYAESGIDAAVLSQSRYMGNSDLEATREANDALLKIIEDYEEFYGLAAIPVAAGGDVAAQEFERCLKSGYNGGAIETLMNGIEITDDALEPVFEVADRTGAPIMVHPLVHESLGADVLDDDYKLNATFGREVALCDSLCKTIHTGILDRYENLNLVFHHTGGGIAGMLGRLELQLNDDIWPGLDDLKSYEEFKRQIEERIYFDTAGHYGDDTILRTHLEKLPASTLMYGTDFPYETRTPEQFQRIVEGIEHVASKMEADDILGRNALDLLVNVDR